VIKPNELLDTTAKIVGNQKVPDLSLRQMAIFLAVNTSDPRYAEDDGRYTVRKMSASLGISKPAVTRALDRLEEFNLVRRSQDANDRRLVKVSPGQRAQGFLSQIFGP